MTSKKYTVETIETTITAFLGLETERIDKLIERVKDSAMMLQKYCIALISAAVTEKIDVRDNRVAEKIAP